MLMSTQKFTVQQCGWHANPTKRPTQLRIRAQFYFLIWLRAAGFSPGTTIQIKINPPKL